MIAPVRLWRGRTVHRREAPFVRAFSHAIAMIDIDIDRLAAADGVARLFGANRRAPIAFRETDYGARSAAVPLRCWAEARFAEAGVALDGGAIRLVTFPRVLGHGFAPISLWLGHGPDGDMRGVIYEVHNTFGERHAYVSAFSPGQRCEADKEFFVSPFWDVSGRYRFTLRNEDNRLELIVENLAPDGRKHVASLVARPRPMTDRTIISWLLRMPFSGLGVVVAIHWQAAILALRGARYHIKPAQSANLTTLAAPADAPAPAERPRKRA